MSVQKIVIADTYLGKVVVDIGDHFVDDGDVVTFKKGHSDHTVYGKVVAHIADYTDNNLVGFMREIPVEIYKATAIYSKSWCEEVKDDDF